jgi:hypothetical protein
VSVSTSGTNILVNGSSVQLRGINIYWDGGGALTDAGAQAVLNEFPGLAGLRVNCFDYPAPATMAPYVNALTAAGVVVEIEDHNYPTCLTGSALTNSANWYASCATYFKSNPLVIFGTQNEPDQSSGNAAVDNEISTIYNAIRGTGNNTLIMLCPIGGWAGQGYLTPSVYANMTNVAWDLHYYAWAESPPDSTNVADAVTGLNNKIAQLVAVRNLPVIIGEYGVSAGVIVGDDVGGPQVVQAVEQSGLSSFAWAWTSGNASLPLLLNSTSGDPSQGLTSNFGVPVAAFIAGGAPTPPPTPPSGSVVAPFIAPGSGSFTIGADVYTLSSTGAVTKNGAAVPGGSGTSLMASLGGVVYAQDGSNGTWYTLSGTTFTQAPVSTSGATVANAAGFLVVSGTKIATLTANPGQIAVNGIVDPITQNVKLLLFYGGVLYQETTSNAWYSNASGSWLQVAGDPRGAVAPGAPTAPTLVPTLTVALTWAAVSGTPTPTYTVQYRLTGTGPTGWQNGPAGLTALSASVTLPGAPSYDFRIMATNSAGVTTSPIVTITG